MLTFNNGVLFRTKKFEPDYRYTLNFVDAWSVDEIVLLDITRPNKGKKGNFFNVVKRFSQSCFVPLTIGGGIRTIDDISTLLNMGADKIVINYQAVQEPSFISQAAQLYGSQCIVVSIDAKLNAEKEYEVYTPFGTKGTGQNPVQWAREIEKLGAGEILIQSIDKDGSLEGYDNHLNKLVAQSVEVPVLVCGGAGKWQDFVDGFLESGAAAVCTTNIYHFTESSIKSAKTFLQNAGIPVRID